MQGETSVQEEQLSKQLLNGKIVRYVLNMEVFTEPCYLKKPSRLGKICIEHLAPEDFDATEWFLRHINKVPFEVS